MLSSCKDKYLWMAYLAVGPRVSMTGQAPGPVARTAEPVGKTGFFSLLPHTNTQRWRALTLHTGPTRVYSVYIYIYIQGQSADAAKRRK